LFFKLSYFRSLSLAIALPTLARERIVSEGREMSISRPFWSEPFLPKEKKKPKIQPLIVRIPRNLALEECTTKCTELGQTDSFFGQYKTGGFWN